MSIKSTVAFNEIQQELETVEDIFAGIFKRCEHNSNAFNIRAHQCNPEVIVSFKLRNYPKEQPILAFRYVDQEQSLKSFQKQSLEKYIRDKIEQSSFDSDGYLFEFVQTVVDSLNTFFENRRNDIKPECKSDIDLAAMGTYVLQYDHMRNQSKYISILKRWCNELELFGRLIFYQRIICHIVQGSTDSLTKFIQRSKTQKVDINSKGQKCKEKMLKILYKCGNNEIEQLFTDWQVLKVSDQSAWMKTACDNKIILSILHNLSDAK